MNKRGFQNVMSSTVKLPVRSTENSAGYDFFVKEDTFVEPSLVISEDFNDKGKQYQSSLHKPTLIPTGVKAFMEHDEVLKLYLRSSLGKIGMHMPNSVGIIDADYYNNENNEGEIMFMVLNFSDEIIFLKKGDRIGQGVFQNYLKTYDDATKEIRKGGLGSTGQN